MTNRFFVLAAAIVAAGIPTIAQADQVSVSVRASDLATSQGRAAVMQRITRDAARLCDTGSLSEHVQAKGCTHEIAGQMVAQLHSPAMVALWNGTPGAEVASRGN